MGFRTFPTSYFYMTIDVLHSLVQSLTKSEKRYCRLLAGRQAGAKGFVRLLDGLLAHATVGEALTADLRRQFPGTSLEPARKHLYRVLMQGLRQFEGEKRIDVQIGHLLHDSQILYERGLVQTSQEQLEKARRLAERHERGLYAVLAARQQAEQWVRGEFDGVEEPVLAGQHARIRQQLDQTQTALQHAALYETLLLRYRTLGTVHGPPETLRLNDLLLEEYQLLSRQKQNSFARQQQHLHFQSAYFRMIGDGAGSLRIYRELDDLFQRHPDLWAEQPVYYAQVLDGILHDLRSLERYDEMTYFLNRLRDLGPADGGLRHALRYWVLYYELLREVDQGRFAEAGARLAAAHAVGGAEALERDLLALALPVRTRFQLVLARMEMGLERLSAALHRLNRVRALPARSLPGGLYRQSRLMSLLLHARLGDADYVSYALRSVERKLKQTGPLSRAEALTLRLVRQWLNGQLRSGASADLADHAGSPADRQLLRDIDLRTWVRAMSRA